MEEMEIKSAQNGTRLRLFDVQGDSFQASLAGPAYLSRRPSMGIYGLARVSEALWDIGWELEGVERRKEMVVNRRWIRDHVYSWQTRSYQAGYWNAPGVWFLRTVALKSKSCVGGWSAWKNRQGCKGVFQNIVPTTECTGSRKKPRSQWCRC